MDVGADGRGGSHHAAAYPASHPAAILASFAGSASATPTTHASAGPSSSTKRKPKPTAAAATAAAATSPPVNRSPTPPDDAQQKKRRRVVVACQTCRRKKVKCRGLPNPSNTCDNCAAYGYRCAFDMDQDRSRGKYEILESKAETLLAALKSVAPQLADQYERGELNITAPSGHVGGPDSASAAQGQASQHPSMTYPPAVQHPSHAHPHSHSHAHHTLPPPPAYQSHTPYHPPTSAPAGPRLGPSAFEVATMLPPLESSSSSSPSGTGNSRDTLPPLRSLGGPFNSSLRQHGPMIPDLEDGRPRFFGRSSNLSQFHALDSRPPSASPPPPERERERERRRPTSRDGRAGVGSGAPPAGSEAQRTPTQSAKPRSVTFAPDAHRIPHHERPRSRSRSTSPPAQAATQPQQQHHHHHHHQPLAPRHRPDPSNIKEWTVLPRPKPLYPSNSREWVHLLRRKNTVAVGRDDICTDEWATRYMLPSHDLVFHLLDDIYFPHLHPLLPILHPPTFRRDIANGRATHDTAFRGLVFCVLTISSRFSTDPRVFADPADPHSAGDHWAAASRLYHQAFAASLINVQVLLLTSTYMHASIGPGSSWTILGVAIRALMDIGLHQERANVDFTPFDQEMRRRVFWAAFILDCIFAVCLGRPNAIRLEDCNVNLPLDVSDEVLGESEASGEPVRAASSGSEGKPKREGGDEDDGHKETSPSTAGGASPESPAAPTVASGFRHMVKLNLVVHDVVQTLYTQRKAGSLPEWHAHPGLGPAGAAAGAAGAARGRKGERAGGGAAGDDNKSGDRGGASEKSKSSDRTDRDDNEGEEAADDTSHPDDASSPSPSSPSSSHSSPSSRTDSPSLANPEYKAMALLCRRLDEWVAETPEHLRNPSTSPFKLQAGIVHCGTHDIRLYILKPFLPDPNLYKMLHPQCIFHARACLQTVIDLYESNHLNNMVFIFTQAFMSSVTFLLTVWQVTRNAEDLAVDATLIEKTARMMILAFDDRFCSALFRKAWRMLQRIATRAMPYMKDDEQRKRTRHWISAKGSAGGIPLPLQSYSGGASSATVPATATATSPSSSRRRAGNEAPKSDKHDNVTIQYKNSFLPTSSSSGGGGGGGGAAATNGDRTASSPTSAGYPNGNGHVIPPRNFASALYPWQQHASAIASPARTASRPGSRPASRHPSRPASPASFALDHWARPSHDGPWASGTGGVEGTSGQTHQQHPWASPNAYRSTGRSAPQSAQSIPPPSIPLLEPSFGDADGILGFGGYNQGYASAIPGQQSRRGSSGGGGGGGGGDMIDLDRMLFADTPALDLNGITASDLPPPSATAPHNRDFSLASASELSDQQNMQSQQQQQSFASTFPPRMSTQYMDGGRVDPLSAASAAAGGGGGGGSGGGGGGGVMNVGGAGDSWQDYFWKFLSDVDANQPSSHHSNPSIPAESPYGQSLTDS